MSEFYQAAARISCAQLCRSVGLERCSSASMDILSDVMVKFLSLLAETAVASSTASMQTEVAAADVLLAMAIHGVTRPKIDDQDCSDIEEFQQWLQSGVPHRSASVARIQPRVASALGAAQGAALAAQQASKDVKSAAVSALAAEQHENRSLDWLEALVSKERLMGHEKKLKNTILTGEDPLLHENVQIIGGPVSIEAFYESRGKERTEDEDESMVAPEELDEN